MIINIFEKVKSSTKLFIYQNGKNLIVKLEFTISVKFDASKSVI